MTRPTTRPLAASLALAAGLASLAAPPPAAAQDGATASSADEATDQTLDLMERLGPLLGAPGADPGAGPEDDAPTAPGTAVAPDPEAQASTEARGPLVPLPAPEARPYPYAILGVRPGMTRDEAVAALEAGAGRPLELAAETLHVRVAAPDGRAVEFAYDVSLETPKRDPYAGLRRMNDPTDVEASEHFTLTLASDVLEGRVLAVHRSLRRLNDAPDALPPREALRAQLEALYGAPSHARETTGDRGTVSATWTWAWGEDGFIPDLEGQPERTLQHEATPGDVRPMSPTAPALRASATGSPTSSSTPAPGRTPRAASPSTGSPTPPTSSARPWPSASTITPWAAPSATPSTARSPTSSWASPPLRPSPPTWTSELERGGRDPQPRASALPTTRTPPARPSGSPGASGPSRLHTRGTPWHQTEPPSGGSSGRRKPAGASAHGPAP